MSRKPELTRKKIRVAAGILVDASGRILITDRLRAAAMQDLWEFPGGKLASGESPGSALRRELAEELGIEISSFDHFRNLEHDYPEMRVVIDFYVVKAWQGVPSGMEGQELRWLKPSELSPDLLLPADAPLLEELQSLQL